MIEKNFVNELARTDPAALCRLGETNFKNQIEFLAEEIRTARKVSPIVLLSGPSASGKTTTASMLTKALRERKLHCGVVSLDNYYRDPEDPMYPRDPDGSLNYEVPGALDIPLLQSHLAALERGEPVDLPEFSFPEKKRTDRRVRLDPKETDVILFEGIHALSEEVMGAELSRAYGIYIRASSEFYDGGRLVIPKNRLRLARRLIRDLRTRGSDVEETLCLWPEVREGEHRFVMQGKKKARFTVDSVHPCEPGLYGETLEQLLSGCRLPLAEELRRSFEGFVPVDPSFVSGDSVIREFIG